MYSVDSRGQAQIAFVSLDSRRTKYSPIELVTFTTRVHYLCGIVFGLCALLPPELWTRVHNLSYTPFLEFRYLRKLDRDWTQCNEEVQQGRNGLGQRDLPALQQVEAKG